MAAQIAKNTKAALTILHITEVPLGAYSLYFDIHYKIDKIEETAKRKGEKFVAAAIAEQNGVHAKTAIEERIDSPVRGITDYADKNAVDLIVVGIRGLGGFKRLLLGSVASGVVHYAHCSVTIVR